MYKLVEGDWESLGDAVEKGGKRQREKTLEELGLHGVGAGSAVDGDGEVLAYSVKGGLKEEENVEIEPYPRDD